MAKPLEWAFRIFDRASSPADRIARALGNASAQATAANTATQKLVKTLSQAASAQARLQGATNKTTQAQARQTSSQAALINSQAKLLRAQNALQRAQGGGGGGGGHMHGGGGGGIFGTAIGLAGMYVTFRALTAFAKGIVNVATIVPRTIIEQGIRATALKEDMETAMGVRLGSDAKARSMVAEAVRFAALTPLTTEETLKGYGQLVGAGMAPEKIMDVMAGVSDLATLNPGMRAEAVEGITRALTQVMATGKFTGEEARQLRNWMFPIGDFYKELAKIIPALKGSDTATVQKAVEQGQISDQAAIIAFKRVMANIGGGELGGISDRASRTLSGLYSTLVSRPQELFMAMDRSPAWESLKRAIGNLNDTLDINTSTGQRVQGALSDMFARWVNKLTEWMQDPAKVEAWVTKMLSNLEQLVPAFTKMAEATATIVRGSAWLLGGGGPIDIPDPLKGPRSAEMARNTLADPNASEVSKYLARKVLGVPQPDAVPSTPAPRPTPSPGPAGDKVSFGDMHFHFGQSTSREDARVAADEMRKALASLIEQANVEVGAA